MVLSKNREIFNANQRLPANKEAHEVLDYRM